MDKMLRGIPASPGIAVGTVHILLWEVPDVPHRIIQDEEIPPTADLRRPYFGMHRFEWPEDEAVEFHLGYGDWIRLLRANGFEILDLIEVQAPADAATHQYYDYVSAEWARQWPAEEIWRARLST